MPGGDRTGPAGTGPMTGWGRGSCAGGRGLGRAGGWGGRGWRHRFYATGLPGWQRNSPFQPVVERRDESASLREQADYLSAELEAVRARLSELEQNKE
ncbi:MAG TPA: DUF5320 domain-containing protein [Candidatus Omnitrophota bacterium]|nr:DUF5320 domain-containing protein [Candidatus Omnitrophota bacterium]